MNSLYLIGGGGHCKSCIDVIESLGEFEIKGIFDIPEKVGQSILGYKIIGSDNDLKKFEGDKDNYFLITLGQIKSADLREKYFSMNLHFTKIISKRAYVSKYAKVGKGSIIMHDAIVNAGAEVGKNCIVNSKALIEHDVIIGDHTHISTGAIINGDCIVGKRCFIGSNSSVKNNIEVADKTIISFGVKHG